MIIFYHKPFVRSVSVFCSQIFTLQLNLQPKIDLTYAISTVKWFFWNFCLRKYFLLFFVEFESLMFHTNIVDISEKMNKRKLLQICLKVTYPTDFCIICIHFHFGRKWKYFFFLFVCLFFFKQRLEWNFLCIGSYDKWFCIKSLQKFANLLLLCKAPTKTRLSERCRKHSSYNVNRSAMFPHVFLQPFCPGLVLLVHFS